ncbi:hypothetical protein [Paenibacillus silviterrae]|nr:hypothetical protein [Paenibacillus chinjuensis]
MQLPKQHVAKEVRQQVFYMRSLGDREVSDSEGKHIDGPNTV